jgi:hypothetical protein
LAGACEVPFEVFSGCELEFETTARLFGEEVIDLGDGWMAQCGEKCRFLLEGGVRAQWNHHSAA